VVFVRSICCAVAGGLLKTRYTGGFWPPACSCTSCSPGRVGLMAPCRGASMSPTWAWGWWGVWRDRWFSRLVLSWTSGCVGRCCVARAQKQGKKPYRSAFTGHGRRRGCGRGLGWLSVWLFGCVVDVEGVVLSVLLSADMRIKEKPCKCRFTGLVVASWYSCVHLSCF
jgi:hypothetical protein